VVHTVAEAEPPAEENVEECSADAAKESGGASTACGLYGPAPHAQSPPPVKDTCGCAALCTWRHSSWGSHLSCPASQTGLAA